MRPALIAAAVSLAAAVSACQGNNAEPAGPERRSAAGEVLGGEVTDDMVPLETIRSTSPAAQRTASPAAASSGAPAERREVLPVPEISGGPEPLPADPSADDAPSPPQP